MLKPGDFLIYYPNSHKTHNVRAFRESSEIIEKLADTELFQIISYHRVGREDIRLFTTEIRLNDKYDEFVRFEHAEGEISAVIDSSDTFEFEYLMESLSRESRIKALYIMDILQKLCK